TLLQHVTWSVNSLCHVIGTRPFTTRRYDRATNLWPLALLSLGESWHNLRQAWRRSPADRYLRQSHSYLRALRLGDRRTLACSRPPGLPPSRARSASVASGTQGLRGVGLARTSFDRERCSPYSEHCSSELNSVHLSGVLPGRRVIGLARYKGERNDHHHDELGPVRGSARGAG